MYDDYVELDSVRLQVDRIDRKRNECDDNVMAIFHEEQPFTWQFVKSYVKEALIEATGTVDFLDVGCGSGVFGLLMAKHFNARVTAIDKSKRAVDFAKKNAILNGLELQVQHGVYSQSSVPERSAKVIGLYPPYHIYPSSVEEKIPQHARGGSDGQGEFKNQLTIADYHLAENGILFFNQMCLGDEFGPRFLRYIPQLITGDPSIVYTNVLPSISTLEFLESVYQGKYSSFVDEVSSQNPLIYYNVGIVKRDGNGTSVCVEHNIDLKGRTWKDRIKLHREIARHEFK